jgi:hypothetical protein
MIDMARRRRTREAAADRLLLSVEEATAGMVPEDVPDWRRRLMFACADPAIDARMRDRGLDPESDPVTRTDFVRRITLQLNDMVRKGKIEKIVAGSRCDGS